MSDLRHSTLMFLASFYYFEIKRFGRIPVNEKREPFPIIPD